MYNDRIAVWLQRELPLICANPDRVVEHGGQLIRYCGGALADLYEARGGRILMAGKPYRPIYDEALKSAEAGRRPPARSLAASSPSATVSAPTPSAPPMPGSTSCSSPAPSTPASSTPSARPDPQGHPRWSPRAAPASAVSCRALRGSGALAISPPVFDRRPPIQRDKHSMTSLPPPRWPRVPCPTPSKAPWSPSARSTACIAAISRCSPRSRRSPPPAGVPAVMLTFEPHPRDVFAPAPGIFRLTRPMPKRGSAKRSASMASC